MSRTNEEKIRSLAGAEVMTWKVDTIPFGLAESNGPLTVKLRGDVVKRYRWWHYPRLVPGGTLQVTDPMHGMRVVAEHEPGSWDEVIHDVFLAGIY